MKELDLETSRSVQHAEKDFYSLYEWCLNPIITLKELFLRLEEELRRFYSLQYGWQREESIINLYLFVCAIACTIDDYISWLPFNIIRLSGIYPKYGTLITVFQKIINLPYKVKSKSKINSVIKFREAWDDYVDRVCRILLENKTLSSEEIRALADELKRFKISSLPQEALKRRMKLNEGYRCQDLTHHDIITLADRLLENNFPKDTKMVIVGPRTAGAYFAPLIKNYFELLGYRNVNCLTVRPKTGLSTREKKQLKSLLVPGVEVILTDDYSNTGQSFKLMQETIKSFGIKAGRITVLAPIHPMRSAVNLTNDEETKIIKLSYNELYKKKLFDDSFITDLINEYYFEDKWNSIELQNNSSIEIINSNMEDHLKDGFQARLKHLYEIKLRDKNNELITKKIIGKCAGWGWLGYHAYLAAEALQGFVPGLIGLRNGILFMNWVDGYQSNNLTASENNREKIISYIAEREQKLKLNEDPRFFPPDTGWGWLEILNILRRPFGVRAGRIMNNPLLEYLKNIITKNPTLIDGKLQAEEWIETNNGIIKIDFEHHNFGAPNFDVVDPAYDLAGACFEFHLSKDDEEKFLSAYSAKTGDRNIFDRILLFKLLYASVVNKKAHEEILENRNGDFAEALNERFIWSWSYLIYTMNSFCAGAIKNKLRSEAKNYLFFLDLDGVLDREVFGFAHSSLNGLYGLALLSENSFSIIPNTGRSVEHVRNYCSTYGFEAGIAEYGSVMIVNGNQSEVPLTDIETINQLNICRAELKNIPGIFLDPNYKYSIRVYRFAPANTKGLDSNEAKEILKKFKLDKLRVIIRADDTYFVGKDNNKGNALIKLKEYFRRTEIRTYAMGDSGEDIPMLEASDFGFAPANCAKEVRQFAGSSKVRIINKYFQNGFLGAVKQIINKNEQPNIEQLIELGNEKSVHRLMMMLLKIVDQSRLKKIIYLIFRKNLFKGRIRF